MTKPALAAATLSALLFLIACLPAALAHGAPEGREIDTRILEDDDGAVAPGGCSPEATQACDNPQNVGGLDLLALDARETYTPNGDPAVSFRVLFQGGKTGVVQTVAISLTAGGAAQTLSFTGNTGGPYNSTTCNSFSGPVVPAGADDHVSAVDCLVTYTTLGVNGTGDALTDIRVLSSGGAKKYDAMPGTWFTNDAQDNQAPRIPVCDTEATPPTCDAKQSDPTGGDQTAGTYTLAGPAQLVDATLSATIVDLRKGPAILDIVLSTPLNGTTQVVALNMSAPATIQASLDAATAIVGNETRTVKLHIVGATKDGMVTITLSSDLGAYQVLSVTVAAAPPPAPVCPTGTGTASATLTSGATTCPTTSDTDSKASGAPEMLFVAGLVLVLALTRRRAA